MAIKVDANYSSQACPICGHTCKENRPNKGLLFVCQNCRYTLHADLVGARNVTMRTLLIRQDWMRTGVLSERPDVADGEAKVARLRRYAQLRYVAIERIGVQPQAPCLQTGVSDEEKRFSACQDHLRYVLAEREATGGLSLRMIVQRLLQTPPS